MHDNLLLDKGVKKGGSYDKTASVSNNKSCPLDSGTAFNSYC